MGLTTTNRIRIATVAACTTLGLLLPGIASAATIPAAVATQYNSTPNCPVSATNTVCVWNVPVDINNLFTAADYGQCPYWAVEKYPALVLGELTADPLAGNWNGGTWLEHAVQEGLGTSSTPASGDIAVWQGTSADPVGHVAYVEAVLPDGAIIVSQMDGNSSAPFPALQGTTEYISPSDLSYFSQTYGLSYVATGNASTTPMSYLFAAAPDPTAPTTTATSISAPTAAVVTTTGASRIAVKKVVVKRPAAKKVLAKRVARKAHKSAKRVKADKQARKALKGKHLHQATRSTTVRTAVSHVTSLPR